MLTPLPPSPADAVDPVHAALEVEITSAEFEWLATGALPKPAPANAPRARSLLDRLAPFGTTPAYGEYHALFDPAVEAGATRAFRGRSVLCLPLLSPFGLASRAERTLVVLLDCTYSAFFVPIAIAFIGSEEWTKWGALSGVDICAGAVFTADIAASFHRAAVVRHNFRRRMLTDGRLVARAYALRGSFLMDVVTGGRERQRR